MKFYLRWTTTLYIFSLHESDVAGQCLVLWKDVLVFLSAYA